MKQLVQLVALCVAVVLSCCLWSRAARTVVAQTDSTGAQAAAELYEKKCATCHGKDGQAKTFKAKFNHARNLTDAAWQTEVSDERIFNSITAGRGKMPAFDKKLTKEQIESLVAHVRSLKK